MSHCGDDQNLFLRRLLRKLINFPFLLDLVVVFFCFALILSLLTSIIRLLLLFLRVSYRKMYVFQLGEHTTDKQA